MQQRVARWISFILRGNTLKTSFATDYASARSFL